LRSRLLGPWRLGELISQVQVGDLSSQASGAK
jgi:hypothetical protein